MPGHPLESDATISSNLQTAVPAELLTAESSETKILKINPEENEIIDTIIDANIELKDNSDKKVKDEKTVIDEGINSAVHEDQEASITIIGQDDDRVTQHKFEVRVLKNKLDFLRTLKRTRLSNFISVFRIKTMMNLVLFSVIKRPHTAKQCFARDI